MSKYLIVVDVQKDFVDEARRVAKLVRTGKAFKENKNEKVIL